MKRFRDWPVFWKIVGLMVFTAAPVFGGLQFYLLPRIEHQILSQRQGTVRSLVESAHSVFAHIHELEQRGTLTPDAARGQALRIVGAMRFDGGNYLWVNDLVPRMVMHPVKPELDGKDLTGFQDKAGKYLFREFVKVVQKDGAGFVSYRWPRPGGDEQVEKLSYVELFEPWGWIVGCGVYLDDVGAEVAALRVRMGVLSGIALLLGVLASVGVARQITGPLQRVALVMGRIAKGDLGQRVRLARGDEVGQLAESADRMADDLEGMVSKVDKSGADLAHLAQELSSTIEQIAANNQQLTAQTLDAAAAAEQMSVTVREVAENTRTVGDAAAEAGDAARSGREVVGRTVTALEEIAGVVEGVTGTVEALGARTGAIGEVVGMIEEIADQTNLLALNAAIEAARAGDQGRGFAVVADEVRKLAERTVSATQTIGETLSAIRSDSQDVVTAMEAGKGQVDQGRGLGREAGETITGVAGQVVRASDQTVAIASAIGQLRDTVADVARNMDKLSVGVKESSSAAQSIAGSARRVAAKADELTQLTRRFRG